jgi:hypothetical protein
MALAGVLAACPAWAAERGAGGLGATGAVGALLLALAVLAGRPGWIAWSLVLLGAEYAASLAVAEGGGEMDAWAPLYAAGLLVAAELAFWSLELRGTAREDAASLRRRLAALSALALAALGLAALVALVTELPGGGGVLWDAVGVAAAVAALAIVARLARRPG